MKRKLFLFDLDGSLAQFSDRSKMAQQNIDALKKIREAGHVVCICTGRDEYGAMPFLDVMEVKGPCITYTGSLVKDEEGKVIYRNTTPIRMFNEAWDEVFGKHGIKGHTIYFLEDQKIYFKAPIDEVVKMGFWDRETIEKRLITDVTPETKMHKYIFVPHLEFRDKAAEIIKARDESDYVSVFWNLDTDERYAFEFESAEVSKWKSSQMIMKHYGIGVEDTFMLGDSRNDISIMKGLKHTFTPSNGEKVIKKLAKYTLETSNEDGCVPEMLEVIEKAGIDLWAK